MTEFAASLITFGKVGFRAGTALRNLRRTMRHAEDDMRLMILRFDSTVAVTDNLNDQINRY